MHICTETCVDTCVDVHVYLLGHHTRSTDLDLKFLYSLVENVV